MASDPGWLPANAEAKVSIEIVTYNQEEFIAEAIESAVGQDYDNLEVVVTDDASTDRTPDIIRDFAYRYSKRLVPVLNQRNAGITGNSNAGLRASSGDLIAFMGGDDVLLPGKIKAQVDWFGGNPRRVLCGHQVETFYEDNSRKPHPLTRRLLSGVGAEQLIRNGPFGATSVMVRRDRIPEHGFDDRLPVVSDQMLWVDVIREDGEFGYVPGTLARYRRHSGNVTQQLEKNLPDIERFLEVVSEKYPAFRRAARYAITRRVYYDPGVTLMERGRITDARRRFEAAIRREPWFARAWVRLAQAYCHRSQRSRA